MTAAPRRGGVVLLTLAAAGAVLVAASRPWVRVDLTTRLAGIPEAVVPGADAAPVVPAVALVALAAGAAVAVAGRRGGRFAGAVVLLAGIVVVAGALGVLLNPVSAAVQAVRQETGGLDVPATAVAATAWPVVATLAGLVLAASGTVVVILAARWQNARRFERVRHSPDDRPSSDWDALDRGIDPTAAPRADETRD